MKLELTQEELQYIVNVISQRPLAECEVIVNNIRQQFAGQNKLEVKK